MERKTLTEIRVFVSSPRDVEDERNRLYRVIQEMNKPGGVANQHHCTLQLLDWHDVVSGTGRPQGVILQQQPPESWDIFIGILWLRFGTPTGAIDPETGLSYDSGTEEEFQEAYRRFKQHQSPRIMFYRCTRSPKLTDLDINQYQKVLSFVGNFDANGTHPGLYKAYEEPEGFERMIREELVKLIPEIMSSKEEKPPKNMPSIPNEFIDRPKEIEELERKIKAGGLVVIFGIFGIGKTWLALKLANQMYDKK